MPDTPNFDKNKQIHAKLVVDRYDFAKHVNGEDFKQESASISLDPVINIAGNNKSNVREAILAFNDIVTAGAIQDASPTVKGIVRLSGDIAGTANTVTVTGLRGRPVNSSVPTNGDSLTWNGTSWTPTAVVGSFTAGGDLTGTDSSQSVITLTGASGFVKMKANEFRFDTVLTAPKISHEQRTVGNGDTLRIESQTASAGNGGNLVIRAGVGNGFGNFDGYVGLVSGNDTLLQCVEVTDGNHILSLLGSVTSTNMPSNTGNRVAFIKDALTVPGGSSTGGAILYSTGGSLYTRRSSGLDFQIGEAKSILGASIPTNSLTSGNILQYNGSTWVPTTINVSFTAAGDLSGNNASQTVIRIRGTTVSSSSPTSGQALIYDGSQWAPTTFSAVFSPGTDLAGTNTNQEIISITGYNLGDGYYGADVLCDKFLFGTGKLPVLTQNNKSSGKGNLFSIKAQSSNNGDGGDLNLNSGYNSTYTSSKSGSIFLNLSSIDGEGTHLLPMVQVSQIATDVNIVALSCHDAITSTQIPGTYDRAVYIGNSTTHTGSVNSGTLLYSTDDGLWIRTPNGSNSQLLSPKYVTATLNLGALTTGNEYSAVVSVNTNAGSVGTAEFQNPTANVGLMIKGAYRSSSTQFTVVFRCFASATFSSVPIYLQVFLVNS